MAMEGSTDPFELFPTLLQALGRKEDELSLRSTCVLQQQFHVQSIRDSGEAYLSVTSIDFDVIQTLVLSVLGIATAQAAA